MNNLILFFKNQNNNYLYMYLILASFDIFSGLLLSIKTKKTNSKIMYTGLVKKIFIISFIVVSRIFNYILNTNKIEITISLAFSSYEILSIIESGSRLGVQMPTIIKKIILMIKENEDEQIKRD